MTAIALALSTLAACATNSTTRADSNNSTPTADASSSAPGATNPDIVSMYVHGFGCPLCATNIERAMLGLRGVSGVDVDLGQGRVDVHTLPGIAPSRTQLAATVKDAGFTLVRFADDMEAVQ